MKLSSGRKGVLEHDFLNLLKADGWWTLSQWLCIISASCRRGTKTGEISWIVKDLKCNERGKTQYTRKGHQERAKYGPKSINEKSKVEDNVKEAIRWSTGPYLFTTFKYQCGDSRYPLGTSTTPKAYAPSGKGCGASVQSGPIWRCRDRRVSDCDGQSGEPKRGSHFKWHITCRAERLPYPFENVQMISALPPRLSAGVPSHLEWNWRRLEFQQHPGFPAQNVGVNGVYWYSLCSSGYQTWVGLLDDVLPTPVVRRENVQWNSYVSDVYKASLERL